MQEVKILAQQAELQQNRSLFVILRNAVTKNLFAVFPYVILRNEVTKNPLAVDTAKILRVRSG